MKLIFCMQMNINVSYKLILSLLMGLAHSQSSQSYKYAISLQYLKKEVHHQSFYKLPLSFLMKVAKHVQSTQNRKLVLFWQYIKKKVGQLLLCSIVMQDIQIFYWGLCIPLRENIPPCGNSLCTHFSERIGIF